MQYPLTLESFFTICKNSGFKLDLLPNDNKARGYNFCYGNDVIICYKEDDSPSGQIHTILHELYEVIDQKLYSCSASEYKRKKNVDEAKADQFSANVHVLCERVFEWINTYGLDIFGLKDFFNCSYITALIQLNKVLCNLINVKTGTLTSVIGILYERPYWNVAPTGRTPQLQFRFHTKSGGFPFRLSRNEIKDIRFYSDNIKKELTIPTLIEAFSNSNDNLLLKNINFVFMNQILTVDVLIRTVTWRKYKYTSKVLIQIIPSEQPNLRHLANRSGITQYEMGGEL